MSSRLTKDQERFALISFSLIELGGSASKSEVLNYIYNHGYLNVGSRDMEYCATLPEEKWRNDLAWARNKMCLAGYLESGQRDCWQITSAGVGYFNDLLPELQRGNLRLISKKAFEKMIMED